MEVDKFFKRFYFNVLEGENVEVLDVEDGVVELYKLDNLLVLLSSWLGLSENEVLYRVKSSKLNPRVYEAWSMDVSNDERTLAVVVMNGCIIEDVNHQSCFEQYDSTFWKDYSVDLGSGDGYDLASSLTDSWFSESKYYGFSVYDDNYMIAHYKDNLIRCYGLVKAYAKQKGYSLGYCNKSSFDVVVINDIVF